ncbi:MAG: hypothetical protein NTW86_23350, partial [Candidatus Sumerlaeota bacterium]|nr:hypothetical protein [Candidatus Sumerlaeota bacterium]
RVGSAEAASAPASAPAGQTNAPAPFPTLSSFFDNETVWEGFTPEQELKAMRQFVNLASISSQVFYVHSRNQAPPDTGQRRPSLSRIRSLILVDAAGAPSVLNWRFER